MLKQNNLFIAYSKRGMGRNNGTDEMTIGAFFGNVLSYILENTPRKIFLEIVFTFSDSAGYFII